MDNKKDENGVVTTPIQTVKHRKWKEMVFLSGVAGMSLCAGFSYTLSSAKKQDPGMFNKGLMGSVAIPESGGALALRALGWGTVYAVAGVGLISFGIWKLLRVKNMQEFTSKVQSASPVAGKEREQGRSEFKSVRELINYILEEDKKKKGKES